MGGARCAPSARRSAARAPTFVLHGDAVKSATWALLLAWPTVLGLCAGSA